jgi:PAS domain S-box-containing protein
MNLPPFAQARYKWTSRGLAGSAPGSRARNLIVQEEKERSTPRSAGLDTEALPQNEQRFRATFHQAAVGIAVAGLDGRFQQVNARFCEILGRSSEELLQKTFLEITHPDDLAKTRENIRRLIGGELGEYIQEKRCVRGDGTVVANLATVTLLRNAKGQPERLVGAIEEITDGQRAEEKAREAAERMQLALSAGRLGDWNWEAATDLVTLGLETARSFGLAPGTVITWQRLRELLHPEDRERARAAVEQALASGQDYDIEYRVLRGGGYVWLAAKGRATYHPDGSVSGMSGVVQDISRQKETEEIRSRLAAVVESSDDAIISMSLDTTITTWNKGAERMFGYSTQEAVGRSVSMLIPEESEDEEPEILKRLLGGARIDHYETIRKRKDGKRLNISLTVSPVYDQSGRIIGVSKISRDVTDRKQAEEALRDAQAELRRHAEHLEEVVAERTARLRETIQELEAFSYSVSHDMRSPLRAMQGYADALLEDYAGKLDPTGQEYLQRIRRAAGRMDLLIQDVLAYSRVAKGEIQLRPVNVENVLRDAIQNYPALQPASADITILTPIPQVLGHEAYLTQIVSNLLGNAVKFVERGQKPRVEIQSEVQGEMVRIGFKDNGIGIAPEHQHQIFQIFGRVYPEKKYEGTGIGLAIAKKAAERMGGSVGVNSELGRGSEFYVILRKA